MLVAATLLTVGVVVFTLLVRSRDLPVTVTMSPLLPLEEKKTRIQEGLRDLQFEHGIGKLSSKDFAKTKLDLEKDLERIKGEIDRLASEAPGTKEIARICPHCGAEFQQEMKFCGACGKPMAGGPS